MAAADVLITELETVGEIALAFELFNGIWAGDEGAVPTNVMKALAHTGNYLAGAWAEDRLDAASLAFAWGDLPARSLHSHITGVVEGWQARGVGHALKLHQRDWAAKHGYARVTWTFDPLVRRNGWFNLVKLGTRIEDYQPDFYGPMNDGLNAGDPTDRCLAVWDIEGPGPAATGTRAAAAVALLECAAGDAPVINQPAQWASAALVSCQTPPDIVAIRRADPDLARHWRLALRETMGAAMNEGFVAATMTRDGRYILENRCG